MTNYEIMFIVRSTLGEDEIKKVVENFEALEKREKELKLVA